MPAGSNEASATGEPPKNQGQQELHTEGGGKGVGGAEAPPAGDRTGLEIPTGKR
jgi:hypothetical protein